MTKQDYGTPDDFIDAVTLRFGVLAIDLAATSENRVAPVHIGLDNGWNSLEANWAYAVKPATIGWLNPPFEDISPWAAKCAETAPELRAGARILLLVPASIGSEWFRVHVHGKAFVHGLNPRLTFKGCTAPYPKDCMLAEFGASPGFDVWRWKEPAKRRSKVAA